MSLALGFLHIRLLPMSLDQPIISFRGLRRDHKLAYYYAASCYISRDGPKTPQRAYSRFAGIARHCIRHKGVVSISDPFHERHTTSMLAQ